jgi:hypothetical protein
MKVKKVLLCFVKQSHLPVLAFPESGDPYCRVEKFYARISTRLGDIDKARELWEHIVRKNGRSAEAWIQYIYFER